MGFAEQDHQSDGMAAIQRSFTPEFRNRLDAIIQFKPLTHGVIDKVVDKLIKQLSERLTEKGVSINLEPNARKWLADHGYDRKMGARPMARLIKENIMKPLADELLFGKLTEGGEVNVRVENDNLDLEFTALIEE